MNASYRHFVKCMHRLSLAGAILFGVVAYCLPALAGSAPLSAQTKLRVTVLQWMPMKGSYEEWPALGGEFVVSDEGTIILPVIGAIPIGDMDSMKLAAEIAKRIQNKTGLVDRPDTTVEVIEYAPIYVVGDVAKPGEYKFRSGLSVLQALALGGGERRTTTGQVTNQIGLVGELRGLEIQILRANAKIARLKAEAAGAETIQFPPNPPGADNQLAAEISQQETIILKAREKAIERQAKSFTELQTLFAAEIDALKQKAQASDDGIKSAERELDGVKVLVGKGLAVVSRQSNLERLVAGYRSDRLDQVTAEMRARQNIAEATRNLEGLHDKHQTEVASEMQDEQARLEQLKLKRDVSQSLLLDMLSSTNRAAQNSEMPSLSYTITRSNDGQEITMPAEESTALLPGDVVKVVSSRVGLATGDSSPNNFLTDNQAEEAGQ